MERFKDFIRLDEVGPQPMGGMPQGPPMGGGPGGPPLPPPGMPPMGGGLGGGMGGPPPPPLGGPGGMGGPPLGGPNAGQQQPQQQPLEIKTKDVWSLLDKILNGDQEETENREDASAQQSPQKQDMPYNALRT